MSWLNGRKILYSDYDEITAENLPAVLNGIRGDFSINQNAIRFLWDYYTGQTEILRKKKEVRPEINNKLCENRAFEIVNFFTGYTFGEDLQYVHSGECKDKDDSLLKLNRLLSIAGKSEADTQIGTWLFVAGTAYRIVLASDGERPIRVYSLRPDQTFVVRSTRVGNEVVMAGTYTESVDRQKRIFTCYTPTKVFVAEGMMASTDYVSKVTESVNGIGCIPIQEYTANSARMGVFEPVLDLLNAINLLQSNRMDDAVQTVNSFLALLGSRMDDDTIQSLIKNKLLFLPEGTDAKYLNCPLNEQAQVFKDDLLNAVLTICGMPNRNGGSSTSDTGSAVILRDGWEDAESRAQTVEKLFKPPEYQAINCMLNILSRKNGYSNTLKAEDIDIKFQRRNYSALQSQVQSFCNLVASKYVHPEVAYPVLKFISDPVDACKRGLEWNKMLVDEENAKNKMLQLQSATAKSGASSESGNQMPEVQKD